MSNAGAIEAGRAVLRLIVDDKEIATKFQRLEASVEKVAGRLQGIGLAMGAVGSAITAPLAGAVTSFINFGSKLDDVSQRVGISVEALSELDYAASLSGTSIETLERAMVAMIRNGFEPARFDEIAASIAGIEDPALQARRALEVFGKSGVELLPLLRDLPQLREECRRLGLTMDAETAAQAARLGDILDRVGKLATKLAVSIGSALGDELEKLGQSLTSGIGEAIRWVKENKNLIVVAGEAGFALLGFGSAAIFVGGAINGTVIAVRALRVALNFLSRNPYLIAFTLLGTALAAAAYKFGWLSDEVDDASASLSEYAKQSQATAVAEQKRDADAIARKRQTNAELARLDQQAADEKLRIQEATDQKIFDRLESRYKTAIAREKQFQDERARQQREAFDSMLTENERDLKEAEELHAALLKQLYPETAARQEKAAQIQAENAELERQMKLLARRGQLEQTAKLAQVRDMADAATAKLRAGFTPSRDEVRALERVTPAATPEINRLLVELKKHTTSLEEIAIAARDWGITWGNE